MKLKTEAKILVVGDLMLDKYWHGSTSRISPEAPVPVVNVQNIDFRAGGAANVAMNISSLGGKVAIIGYIGADENGKQLQSILDENNIITHLITTNEPTICKLRVLSHHQQLIRLDFEEILHHTNYDELLTTFSEVVASYDLVVLSDYAKGVLGCAASLISIAKSKGKPVFVDPKNADFDLYKNATLIKPNLKEFELSVSKAIDNEELLYEQACLMIEKYAIEYLLITRSDKGMSLIDQEGDLHVVESAAQEVFDVTGAGDTVMAAISLFVASGYSFKEAISFANLAAACAVSKVGTTTVTLAELERALSLKNVHKGNILNLDDLSIMVRSSQARGEKVVFTNGCFDLLHSGHLRYLEEASALGDRLVIGVNSDSSVKSLKGSSRPIVSEKNRMDLLAGLRCVDWVVMFDEDTPENLIHKINPDVLVKGGDYKPSNIVGADYVHSYGGDVRVLSFLDDFSTTNIVNKIKGSQ